MFRKALLNTALICLCAQSPLLSAQEASFAPRLSQSILDVFPPSERVSGALGEMRFTQRDCRELPTTQVRRRIVNTAVQEWAFFGYSTDLQAREPNQDSSGPRRPFVYPRLTPTESERLASSIAGYWSATPNSEWILQRQNSRWETDGAGARWRDAWSAAFVSWVMCEGGLGEPQQFKRAIAHHSYIDQAILAAQDKDDEAVYKAYPLGSHTIVPGDLLCRGSRPLYRSIEQRAAQLGEGARTHCDIVVKVDVQNEQISVIGGNVRATVRMKVLPAINEPGQALRPIADNGRQLFAHLKLMTPEIEANAFDHTPTIEHCACNPTL